MQDLIKDLKKQGVLKTSNIMRAFAEADRRYFVSESLKSKAYADQPLPIGWGQTISQPYTVAFMLELLAVKSGQKVLDIGSGSGWTTALLASLVGPKGKVFGVEILPSLYEIGKQNLQKFSFKNIQFYNQSGFGGLPGEAPFDRILVSAAAEELPGELVKQLAPFGRLVIPVKSSKGQEIVLAIKDKSGTVIKKFFPGFAFVPLIK